MFLKCFYHVSWEHMGSGGPMGSEPNKTTMVTVMMHVDSVTPSVVTIL